MKPIEANLFCSIKNYNADGKLIYELPQRESNSYVRNAWTSWNAKFVSDLDATYGAGGNSLKEADGVTFYTSGTVSMGRSDHSGAGDSGRMSGTAGELYGIVVGQDTTAETFEDYAMLSRIQHGSAAGELVYNQHNTITPAYNAATKTWTVNRGRYFNNNSGGDITINDIGMYNALRIGGSEYEYFLHCRDVLGTAVVVPDAGQVLVSYIHTLTLPI